MQHVCSFISVVGSKIHSNCTIIALLTSSIRHDPFVTTFRAQEPRRKDKISLAKGGTVLSPEAFSADLSLSFLMFDGPMSTSQQLSEWIWRKRLSMSMPLRIHRKGLRPKKAKSFILCYFISFILFFFYYFLVDYDSECLFQALIFYLLD